MQLVQVLAKCAQLHQQHIVTAHSRCTKRCKLYEYRGNLLASYTISASAAQQISLMFTLHHARLSASSDSS